MHAIKLVKAFKKLAESDLVCSIFYANVFLCEYKHVSLGGPYRSILNDIALESLDFVKHLNPKYYRAFKSLIAP